MVRVFWLIRGEPAVGRVSRAATLYSVGSMSDPDHEAAIRFSGEAPRWRAHSGLGSSHDCVRVTTTPDHDQRPLRQCAKDAKNWVLFRSCSITWFKRQPSAS